VYYIYREINRGRRGGVGNKEEIEKKGKKENDGIHTTS
jgi:hypothetical protein